MIREVGGLGLGGPRGKGSLSDAKGPKPPIQLLQSLKNSLKEVKRVHFGIYRVPPGPTQEMKLMGPGGDGPSRSPRFLQPCIKVFRSTRQGLFSAVSRSRYVAWFSRSLEAVLRPRWHR